MANKYSNLVQSYRYPNPTINDIYKVVQEYPTLDVKQEKFVFTDGRTAMLVNLQGTIPVKYKNNKYNIPIIIWLMDTHPDHAPMCYVKPTANMTIHISHHVDHCGKIYAPYLHDWAPYKSDLLSLIQVLITLFAEQPPLYSRVTTSAPAPAMNSTPYPTQPTQYYMPMPGTAAPANLPYSMGPTPTPPYPTAETGNPPYPLRPPLPTPYPPMPVASNAEQQRNATITEQHIHLSLVSAAEDKVRRHLREHLAQANAELDSLGRIQDELVTGKERLTHLMNKLETEQSEWEKMLATLRDKELELDTSLLNISKQEDMDVDEAVITTTPLYKQLLNAFAEEAATEDAIYYLGEGLRRGVIDLDVFLKHVRSLSRKQFMLRALMHKCRNKAGLAS